jgi:hypothetical protein
VKYTNGVLLQKGLNLALSCMWTLLPQDLVRRQFKLLARLIHPDKCALPQAQAAFQKVHTAFVNLTQIRT